MVSANAVIGLWVVFGQTGEYSDHNEWPVMAFTSEAKANAWEKNATDWLVARGLSKNNSENVRNYTDYPDEPAKKEKSPWDPSLQVDYTGTDYYVAKIDLAVDRDDAEALGDALVAIAAGGR